MVSFSYMIQDPEGLHALSASRLAAQAQRYRSFITITGKGREVDMKKPLKILSLMIPCGETVIVRAEGDDEDQAGRELEDYFKRSL